jgi:hypothetical protein
VRNGQPERVREDELIPVLPDADAVRPIDRDDVLVRPNRKTARAVRDQSSFE